VAREIYLIRHGETDCPGVLLGQKDAGLSAEGRRQAGQLARQLHDCGVEAIRSSSLLRARETAGILANALRVPAEADPGLDEISYGRWDGLSWQEIETAFPDLAKQKLERWWEVIPPGGEPSESFFARIRRAWERMLRDPRAVIAVVAHQAVNAALYELSRLEPEGRREEFGANRLLNYRQAAGSFRILRPRRP